ncbi:MAG: hypothetical protein VX346_15845 [Planctomycetota bacterium]|nr:hypothetical protein [Planctomycetota bacterium]
MFSAAHPFPHHQQQTFHVQPPRLAYPDATNIEAGAHRGQLGAQPTIKENIGFKTVQTEEVRWLQRMLKWRPSLGESEAGRVKELLAESDDTGLIDLGLSSLPLIEAKLATEYLTPSGHRPIPARVRAFVFILTARSQIGWRHCLMESQCLTQTMTRASGQMIA